MGLLSSFLGQLARLLLRGFERKVAKSVSAGMGVNAIDAFIRSREPLLSRGASRALAEFVEAARRAAELIEAGPDEEEIPIGEMPVNEMLFDPDPLGDFYVVDATVSVCDGQGNILKTYAHVSVRDSQILTNLEVKKALGDAAVRIFMKYDEKAIGLNPDDLSGCNMKLNLAERKY